MAIVRSSCSTRKVRILFVAVALMFVSAFGWLAWRLLQQDRVLARQRRLEQLVAAADRVNAAMYRRLGELEEALADPQHGTVAPGAVLVRARRDGVVVRPPDGLVYLPFMPTGVEPPLSTFAGGALEYQLTQLRARPAPSSLGRQEVSRGSRNGHRTGRKSTMSAVLLGIRP